MEKACSLNDYDGLKLSIRTNPTESFMNIGFQLSATRNNGKLEVIPSEGFVVEDSPGKYSLELRHNDLWSFDHLSLHAVGRKPTLHAFETFLLVVTPILRPDTPISAVTPCLLGQQFQITPNQRIPCARLVLGNRGWDLLAPPPSPILDPFATIGLLFHLLGRSELDNDRLQHLLASSAPSPSHSSLSQSEETKGVAGLVLDVGIVPANDAGAEAPGRTPTPPTLSASMNLRQLGDRAPLGAGDGAVLKTLAGVNSTTTAYNSTSTTTPTADTLFSTVGVSMRGGDSRIAKRLVGGSPPPVIATENKKAFEAIYRPSETTPTSQRYVPGRPSATYSTSSSSAASCSQSCSSTSVVGGRDDGRGVVGQSLNSTAGLLDGINRLLQRNSLLNNNNEGRDAAPRANHAVEQKTASPSRLEAHSHGLIASTLERMSSSPPMKQVTNSTSTSTSTVIPAIVVVDEPANHHAGYAQNHAVGSYNNNNSNTNYPPRVSFGPTMVHDIATDRRKSFAQTLMDPAMPSYPASPPRSGANHAAGVADDWNYTNPSSFSPAKRTSSNVYLSPSTHMYSSSPNHANGDGVSPNNPPQSLDRDSSANSYIQGSSAKEPSVMSGSEVFDANEGWRPSHLSPPNIVPGASSSLAGPRASRSTSLLTTVLNQQRPSVMGAYGGLKGLPDGPRGFFEQVASNSGVEGEGLSERLNRVMGSGDFGSGPSGEFVSAVNIANNISNMLAGQQQQTGGYTAGRIYSRQSVGGNSPTKEGYVALPPRLGGEDGC